MIWLILLVALALIFGLGTILEATLWVLLILAVLAIVGVLGVGRLLGGGDRRGGAAV